MKLMGRNGPRPRRRKEIKRIEGKEEDKDFFSGKFLRTKK